MLLLDTWRLSTEKHWIYEVHVLTPDTGCCLSMLRGRRLRAASANLFKWSVQSLLPPDVYITSPKAGTNVRNNFAQFGLLVYSGLDLGEKGCDAVLMSQARAFNAHAMATPAGQAATWLWPGFTLAWLKRSKS